ncbi:alpha/beta hydrolase family protein [Cyclobacterium jeungdonense]|uniref:Acetylxylan esterase n=1 Tax=Cyclobacterium jeungdonense TaxID=708087 RepID=A0ABT8CDB1_9BACT|nr:acetylxylan esterase [Cyclobacterium jeungdonense]MDN3690392.1 acetylxylan esterase [Cyclobacterium jeungdonense]
MAFKSLLFLSLSILFIYRTNAQDAFNYEESKVPPFSLPDPFVSQKGKAIKTIQDWEFLRRGEIISLFENQVYGQLPRSLDNIRFQLVSEDKQAMSGNAHLKEIDIQVERNEKNIRMRLILFIPTKVNKPAPVFLLITHRDPENIDPTREVKMGFWPAEAIVARGFAAATFHVKDVSDDNNDTFKEDILNTLYPEQLEMENGMRGLGSWAWGAMRAMDYFETDPLIDANRAAVVGHSRGGKASLWTGAQDTRWAITISNESGCGGAALSRRKFGETVKRINTSFPYWFTDNFNQYNDHEELLPIDQHMLVAAIAPRAVYVASASEDQWADPKGEFLSLSLGTRVHREIYGMNGSFPSNLPAIESPLHLPYAGHHIREGKHNLTPYDWERFMDFADQLYGINHE